MTSTSPARAVPASAPRAAASPGRLVTDAPQRTFHALFALSFLGAYVTAESERWRALHVTLGYALAGLLVLRVLYGLFGPRHAGLGALWRKLAGAPAWLRSAAAAMRQPTFRGVNGRQGQNLAMAGAVVALLALAVPLTLSGYATYAGWGDLLGGEWLEELHESLGNAFGVVVLAHLALIAALSLLRRKNQALPMLTGRIDGPGPDLVKQPRGGLAVLMLVAWMAFITWQWQQSPQGLLPTPERGGTASHRHPDD